MGFDSVGITHELTSFTNLNLLNGQGDDLTHETPILELGILDSLSMVSLLSFIEETYGVRISEDQIVPQHFSDLASITQLIISMSDGQTRASSLQDELRQLVSLQRSYGLKSKEIDTIRGRHHVLETKGAEPAWVLLPALGNPSTSWAHVMRTLSGEQKTIAPDFGGFGLSVYADDAPTYRDHVDATLSLLDQIIHAPIVLVASSAGAMIATEVARQRPDKVKALIITGFGLIEEPTGWWRNLQAMSETPQKFMDAAYYTPPELTPALLRILEDVLARPAYHNFLDVEGLAEMSTTFDNIDLPTLFVAGEDDQIIGRKAVEAACKLIPNARIEWIARCGHFPPVERPQPFLWYVREFLNSL
ncbi:MAG: alpha/beta fold hydrolase [Hyphomicrobiales bacterium]